MAELPEPEIYTPERIVEFLLNNAYDAEEYRIAVAEAFALGVDPRTIPIEYLDQSQPWQRLDLYCGDALEQRTS